MKFFLLAVVLIATIDCSFGQFKACFKDGTKSEFSAENVADYLDDDSYDPLEKLVIYIFAVLPESTSMFTEYRQHFKQVVKAYEKTDNNFMSIDLDEDSKKNGFDTAAIQLKADNIANGILKMVAKGLKVENIEVIGFSLGAQIAGHVGKKIQELSDYQLPFIVALEASLVGGLETADAEDADFVMTVRTEHRFSDADTKGHANFIFNHGLLMTQCYFENFGFYDQRCASERAQLIWAEAVSSGSDKIFGGYKCKDMLEFDEDDCSDEVGYMNPKVSRALRGDYYVVISAEKNGPFHVPL